MDPSLVCDQSYVLSYLFGDYSASTMLECFEYLLLCGLVFDMWVTQVGPQLPPKLCGRADQLWQNHCTSIPNLFLIPFLPQNLKKKNNNNKSCAIDIVIKVLINQPGHCYWCYYQFTQRCDIALLQHSKCFWC